MKKTFTRMLIVFVAVICAMSVQITVSAQTGIVDNGALGNMFGDLISQIVSGLNPDNNTTAENPENTTVAPNPDNTTTEPGSMSDNPVNNSGTGTIVTTTEPTVYYPPVTQAPQNTQTNVVPQITTTERAGDEEMSFTYDSSLSGLLEADSAAIIVQKPSETYTLGGIIVDNGGNKKDDMFSWQKIALIAAAGLFVILAALVVALLIQRNTKKDNAGSGGIGDYNSADDQSGPVAVEVMSAERIAELLGSSPKRNGGSAAAFDGLTGAESAAAIKTASLMGQLNSYSDPLIRKYTEEPVRFSPFSNPEPEAELSAAEILKATEAMLNEITGNEKYASDISGLSYFSESIDDILGESESKICPDCKKPVAEGDVFCHSCGAYVG